MGGDLVTSFYMGHGALHIEIVGLGRYRILWQTCVKAVMCEFCWLAAVAFLGLPRFVVQGKQQGS